MRLTRIVIKNYKSLRDVTLLPRSFSVFVGRNGSGKSNLADALEFIALAYSHGLEHAVAKKGGFENIAHRKERRSRAPISFEIEISANMKEVEVYPHNMLGDRVPAGVREFIFRHSFSMKTTGGGIRSEFKIIEERLDIISWKPDSSENVVYEWIHVERDEGGRIKLTGDLKSLLAQMIFFNASQWDADQNVELALSPTELLFEFPFIRPRLVGRFTRWLSSLSIFQVSPEVSRHAGVPTPNPLLSSRGENLPAVVDWLQSKSPKEWRSILRAMKEIVPELEEISVHYLHTRTLGLLFKEAGVGRPWGAEDVSDGTIRSLAMLVACFDPRVSALVLEEPENSLHPWIIREVVEHLRKLSSRKMVMVTTHSPIVLNIVSPADVWVVYKRDGETQIRTLTEFDPRVQSDWEAGKYRLFDYLESGAISEAVPAGGQ